MTTPILTDEQIAELVRNHLRGASLVNETFPAAARLRHAAGCKDLRRRF